MNQCCLFCHLIPKNIKFLWNLKISFSEIHMKMYLSDKFVHQTALYIPLFKYPGRHSLPLTNNPNQRWHFVSWSIKQTSMKLKHTHIYSHSKIWIGSHRLLNLSHFFFRSQYVNNHRCFIIELPVAFYNSYSEIKPIYLSVCRCDKNSINTAQHIR